MEEIKEWQRIEQVQHRQAIRRYKEAQEDFARLSRENQKHIGVLMHCEKYVDDVRATRKSPPLLVANSDSDGTGFPVSALSGKGVRGTIPLEIVGEMETIYDPENDSADVRLADVTDGVKTILTEAFTDALSHFHKPVPDSHTSQNKGDILGTVNAKLAALLVENQDMVNYSSRQLAQMLGCGKTAILNSTMWKEIQRRKEGDKNDQMARYRKGYERNDEEDE